MQNGKATDTIIVQKSGINALVTVDDDEIRYNGKMFDIKNRVIKNGNILLIGHYDSFDNKLYTLLFKLLEPKHTPLRKHDNNVLPFAQYDAILNTTLPTTIYYAMGLFNKVFPHIHFVLHPIHLDTEIHPPE